MHIREGANRQEHLPCRISMTGFSNFERAAAPRLKEIFERDLNWTISVKMIEQLDRLRVAEEQRRKSEQR